MESPLIVIESVAVPPAMVAVTALAPGAPAPLVQLYATGDEKGDDVSSPPVELAQPAVADTSGKVTVAPLRDTWLVTVALSANDPVAVGRNHCVLVVGSKYWSPAPLTSVGGVTLTVGTSGVSVNVAFCGSGLPPCTCMVWGPVVVIGATQLYVMTNGLVLSVPPPVRPVIVGKSTLVIVNEAVTLTSNWPLVAPAA